MNFLPVNPPGSGTHITSNSVLDISQEYKKQNPAIETHGKTSQHYHYECENHMGTHSGLKISNCGIKRPSGEITREVPPFQVNHAEFAGGEQKKKKGQGIRSFMAKVTKAHPETESILLGQNTSLLSSTQDSGKNWDIGISIPELLESSDINISLLQRRGPFRARVSGVAGGGLHDVWICNNILEQLGVGEDRPNVSYQLFILAAPNAKDLIRIAKRHIEFQLEGICGLKTGDQIKMGKSKSLNIPKDYVQQNEIEKIDCLIKKVIASHHHIPQIVKLSDNGKKSLSFIQSIGYVKIDLTPELKLNIDIWFLELRDNLFSKVSDFQNFEIPNSGSQISSDDVRFKIHDFLSKLHGELVLGIIGSVVMLNNDAGSIVHEGNLLKKVWVSIAEHWKTWNSLTASELHSFYHRKSTRVYRSPMALDAQLLFEYLFQKRPETPVSSTCVWDMVQRCFHRHPVHIFEAPPYEYFANKLNTIKENMIADNISGISHNLISLHFFQSTLNAHQFEKIPQPINKEISSLEI